MYYYFYSQLQWYYQNLKKENIQISLLCFVISYIIYLFCEVIAKKCNQTNKDSKVIFWFSIRGFCLGVLVAYLYLVAYYTILVRSTYDVPHYNLELFWSYKKAIEGYKGLLVEIILNYILLIPEGILIPVLLFRKKRMMRFVLTFILGLLTTSIIELSQLYFKRGLFEFDDIINNTIGVLFGYLIYIIIRGIWNGIKRQIEKKKKDKS